MPHRLCLLVLCALMLSGCSLADLLNASIPRDGYTITRDVAYGTHPRQKFDLYLPDHAQRVPLVVFFYGGSWQNGSKADYRFLGQALTEQGIAVAVVDYRLYPEVRYPTFVEDAAHAVAYLHQHAHSYGADPDALYVAGHSAGAYIAIMVGADPHYLENAGGKRNWVRGIIGIAGPYNFLPFTDDTIKAIFSTAPDANTQPINHLVGKIPPVFLATGADDDTVDPRNSTSVRDALVKRGTQVTYRHYPDTGHIGIILSLAEGFRDRTPLRADIKQFVKRNSPTSKK